MDTQQELELQQKQQYLRNNIIQQGYDPQQFVSYCMDKYGQVDLQLWNMNKLQGIVQAYISHTNLKRQKEQQGQDQQWNDYEDGIIINPNQTQIKHDKNQIKIQQSQGLIFNEADWDIFLSGGSVQVHQVQKKSPQKKQIKHQITFQGPLNYPKLEPSLSIQKKTPQKPQQKIIKQVSQIQQLKSPRTQSKQIKKIRMNTIKNKILPPLPLINDIQILQTQQISRNFFQGEYTVYTILFRPSMHTIKRKFNDFRRLRSILQKLYPTIRLPYLQPQGWLVNSSQGRDPQLLSKYKWMVIQFLKYIIMTNQQLKLNPLIKQFVELPKKQMVKQTGQKKDYIKRLLDQYNNHQKPKIIGELSLSISPIQIQVNPKYLKSIQSYYTIIPQIQSYYQKLKKQLQLLNYNYQQVSKSLAQLANTFQVLQNCINKYRQQSYLDKIKIYDGLKQMCMKLQNNFNQHNIMFKNRISSLFRYQKDNIWTIKEIIDTKNKIYAEYQKQGSPQSPITKLPNHVLDVDSNIPLQQPCKNTKNTLAIQYQFWQHVCFTQIEKYLKYLRLKINEQISLIAYQELDMENQNLNFWNTTIKKCIL